LTGHHLGGESQAGDLLPTSYQESYHHAFSASGGGLSPPAAQCWEAPIVHEPLPVLLPHKLDWVQLAYNRFPEHRKARDEQLASHRYASQQGKRPASAASLLPPSSLHLTASLFDKRDFRIDPVVASLIDERLVVPNDYAYERPSQRKASAPSYVAGGRTIRISAGQQRQGQGQGRSEPALQGAANGHGARPRSSLLRSQSETVLVARLAELGTYRKWEAGRRGRSAGKGGQDIWSAVSFDRIAGY